MDRWTYRLICIYLPQLLRTHMRGGGNKRLFNNSTFQMWVVLLTDFQLEMFRYILLIPFLLRHILKVIIIWWNKIINGLHNFLKYPFIRYQIFFQIQYSRWHYTEVKATSQINAARFEKLPMSGLETTSNPACTSVFPDTEPSHW